MDLLSLKEEDVTKMLSATTHIGSTNLNFQMEQYIYKRRYDGVYIINLKKVKCNVEYFVQLKVQYYFIKFTVAYILIFWNLNYKKIVQ